jgi:hypothetical protein
MRLSFTHFRQFCTQHSRSQSYDFKLQRQRCKKFTMPRAACGVLKSKIFFFLLWKTLSLLQRWRCICKFQNCRIGSIIFETKFCILVSLEQKFFSHFVCDSWSVFYTTPTFSRQIIDCAKIIIATSHFKYCRPVWVEWSSTMVALVNPHHAPPPPKKQ